MAEADKISIGERNKMKTIRELILTGRRDRKDPNGGMGLAGTICIDSGSYVTVRVPSGVTRELSRKKGQRYVIRDLVDSAPWNPNERKAVLVINYLQGLKEDKEKIYTYLEERFNDEVKY